MKKLLPPALLILFLSSVFGVYFMTLAPDLVWDPPGLGTLLASVKSPEFFCLSPSPLYFLLAQGWKRIPWGTLARGGNLFSMFFALFGVGLVYLAVLKLSKDLKFALFGGVTMAFFPLFWPFALVTNFYTLLFFFSFLGFFLLLFDRSGRFHFLGAFLIGLAVSTHPGALVLFLPVLFYLWVGKQHLGIKGLGFSLLGVFLSLVPTFSSWFLFGLPLEKVFSSLAPLTPLLSSFWQNFLSFAELFLGTPWLLFPLALIGALWGVGGRKKTLLLLAFASSLMLLGIYPLPDSLGLFIFPIALFIIWAALGAKVVWDLISLLSNTEIGAAFETQLFVLVFRLKRKVALFRYILLGAFLFFLLFLPFKDFRAAFFALDRSSDRQALEYGSKAWERLSSEPSQSLVLAQEERLLSSLRYFSSLEPEKNVLVISTSSAFGVDEWVRLGKFYPELRFPVVLKSAVTEEEADEALRLFVGENLEKFGVFLALDPPARGRGAVAGRWGEYRLISEEPLYRVER